MRCVQVDEKARKCSHTSARSAAHWLLPAPSFWRRRKQFQCCRILLVQIQDIAMFSLFARRGAGRSAMPLMQAVRTSDSVCFNIVSFARPSNSMLFVYCVLRLGFVSAPRHLRKLLFAAASGTRRPSSALTRRDKVEGQRYACHCVSTRTCSYWVEACWLGMISNPSVFATMQGIRLWSDGAVSMRRRARKHYEIRSVTGRSGQSGCGAQKCCIGGINNGVGRLVGWLTHFLLPT